VLILNKTLKNVSFVTLGNFLNALLGFVSLILVSRYLGPEQFGIFSIVFGFFTLISKFGDLGTNHTLVRYVSFFRVKKEEKLEKQVVGFGLGLTYLFIFLSLVFLIPLHQLIANFLNVSEYSFYLLLAIIFSFGFILFNTYNVLLQALEKFQYYLYAYSFSSLFKITLILVLIVTAKITILNFLLIYFFAPILGYLFARHFFFKSSDYLIKPNLSRGSLKTVTPFLYFMGAASIFGALSEQIGVFLSAVIFTSYEVGLYSAASKLSIVFGLIAGSIGTVLLPRASRYVDSENIKKFAYKTFLLGLVLLILIIPVIIFPKFFLTVTAGSEYIEGAKLLSVLAIAGGLSILTGSFSSVFYSLNKASFFALTSLFGMGVELPLMYLLGTKIGVDGLVYAKLAVVILTLVTSFVFYFYYLRSHSKSSKIV
jgi:O-antigen/teichoic acid export membrane protein